ncbi:MFS transporter [Streptomyces koyangensis]|uniref:MFS transporter n=1 Tax=Streptomyces koyangensis TaxID=188770 RepID=UPI003BF4E8E1
MALDFLFQVVHLVIIMAAQQDDVPSGQIGVMAAMFGVGGLLGALAAPRLHRRLRQRHSVLMVLWAMAVLAPVSLTVTNGLLLGLLLAGMAFFAPTANTAVSTYQLLTTPDRLRGRLSGIIGLVSGVSAALGPLAGGLTMERAGPRWTVVAAAAGTAVIAVVAPPSARPWAASPRPRARTAPHRSPPARRRAVGVGPRRGRGMTRGGRRTGCPLSHAPRR